MQRLYKGVDVYQTQEGTTIVDVVCSGALVLDGRPVDVLLGLFTTRWHAPSATRRQLKMNKHFDIDLIVNKHKSLKYSTALASLIPEEVEYRTQVKD